MSPVFFVPKKDGKKEDGAELSVFEQLVSQEQLSVTTDFESNR